MYQLFRYGSMGLKRDHAISRMKMEYIAAKQKIDLFEKLGVKRAVKGLVMYKDGEYVKE